MQNRLRQKTRLIAFITLLMLFGSSLANLMQTCCCAERKQAPISCATSKRTSLQIAKIGETHACCMKPPAAQINSKNPSGKTLRHCCGCFSQNAVSDQLQANRILPALFDLLIDLPAESLVEPCIERPHFVPFLPQKIPLGIFWRPDIGRAPPIA